jgi:hypothetical protein
MHVADSVSEAEVSLVVIRGDGTREEIGTYYYSKSPWKRLLYKIRGWKT